MNIEYKGLSKLQTLQHDIVDLQELISREQIAGRDPRNLQEALVMKMEEYTELATKCEDEYAGLMIQVELISTNRNAQAVDDLIRDRYHQPDRQVEALRNYLQNLCTHEEVELVTRGSMFWSQAGEPDDNIEEYLICKLCGKEVTNGADIQDGPDFDF